MDNRDVLHELWNKYKKERVGSIEERVETVMGNVRSLPQKYQSEDRLEQYKSFLKEAETTRLVSAESAQAKGFIASIPAMFAGGYAGGKIGRVFGPFGALAGSVAGGWIAGSQIEKAVARAGVNKSVKNVIDNYVTVLDRID